MDRLKLFELETWKNKQNRKPLILKGARQVGKTWLMKEFGKRYFKNFAYINFDNNTRMQEVFKGDYNISKILESLCIESGEKIIPNDTLIIFDEIQECPKALSSLKYFYENASEYAIIAASSLLGVAIHNGTSFPVGKVDTLELAPLCFTEFLFACGEENLVSLIEKKDWQLIEVFRDRFIDLLKKYYFIGGMPEVVQSYIDNKDFNEVRYLQKQIIEMYENDFSKHTTERELPKLRLIWNSIPMQLSKENKKFFFGKIKEGSRAKDFEIAIEWLLDCGLIKKVYNVTKPFLPLKAYTEFSGFKLFLVDIGLLCAMTDLSAKTILEKNQIFTEFKGALTEQFVLQQLISETDFTPYYFTETKSEGEIDFLVQKDDKIIPIEVKAEENLKAKSLKLYCQKYSPQISVRTSMSNYREETWMTNVPLYAVAQWLREI